jgi:D-apionolactonase
MAAKPSRGICLFGTDESVEPLRLLKAGPLSAEFEAGNLRYIRFHGIEMIRALSYIVRDRNWGTYNPRLSNLLIEEKGDSFVVSYDAEAGDAEQSFRYSARIVGQSDGSLRFEGKGAGVTDFVTNRTGFVVLHPIEGVAGSAATIEHVDGRVVDTHFPSLIDPVQPMMDLRAITHEFSSGAKVRCLMEGDTFEMEDQRNWSDASYKTYVRPLALPWPYVLNKGAVIEQAVSLSVKGKPSATSSGGNDVVKLSIGAEVGEVPHIGAGLDVEDCDAVRANLSILKELKPHHVICHFDPRRGQSLESLRQQVALAHDLGAQPWLEAVIANVDGWEGEVIALGEAVQQLGRPFPVVMLSPASDLKCTLPGSVWPPCPPASELFKTARVAFGDVKLTGGMFSYFTELNRKRPPLDVMDSVSFTTSAMVHAGDDRSVTETLESLPHIARSVRAMVANKPWYVGPSAIGMRDNPYGAKVADNPDDIRQAMNRNDPRQRGLLGAAFDIGYFAHFAYGKAAAVALGGLMGPFGAVYGKTAWKQPYFDEHKGVYPVYHARRALSQFAGGKLLACSSSSPRNVQLIAAKTDRGTEIVVANLTGENVLLEVSGLGDHAHLLVFDESNFVTAANDSGFLNRAGTLMADGRISLSAYAFARILTH